MFRVTRILSKGWFRNTVEIEAIGDFEHVRRTLRYSQLRVVTYAEDRINIGRSERFVVRLPCGMADLGSMVHMDRIERCSAFSDRWIRVKSF